MLIALLLLALSTAATSAEYYRWVDEDGTVHYSAQAPESQQADTVAVDTGEPASTSGGESFIERFEVQQRERAERQSARDGERAKRARDRRDREAACALAQQQFEQLDRNRRFVRTGENGDRQYLNDDERLQLLDELREFRAENC